MLRGEVRVGVRQSLVTLGCLLALAAAETSAAATQEKPAKTSVTCEELQDTARKHVLSAIERNSSCTTDADCTMMEINTLCFDLCWRAVNNRGVGEVQKAMTHVNQTWGKTYEKQGCTRLTHGCLPPPPAICREHVCGTP